MKERAILSDIRSRKVGIFDHTGSSLGGAQLVNAHLAERLSQDHDVELIHTGKGYSLEDLERAFGVRLGRVKECRVNGFPDGDGFGIPGSKPFLRQIRDCRTLTKPYDLFIYSGLTLPPFCYARHGLVYCHFPFDDRPDEGAKAQAGWARRHLLDRWIRAHTYRLLWRIQIRGYSRILANSSFTAGWIAHRWGRPADVVYPPIELDVPKKQKRNFIVSAGRFTSGRRSKNQREQVQAFREFLGKCPGGWSLCIIGFCTDSPNDQEYLRLVQRQAHGLPVSFLVNAERGASAQLFAEAKLFWHTAGLGVSELERPQEAEHFGIATVEAMRAGCVPVVIASGGQREIIVDGVSGFLAKDLSEVTERSLTLAHHDRLFTIMREQARERSMLFTKEAFNRRIASIVSECLNQ